MADIRETIDRHVEYLVGIQNVEDGGWGVEAGFPSSPLNTAEVLTALLPHGARNGSTVTAACHYLISKQLPDGGWTSQRRSAATDAGQTVTTSWAIRALSQAGAEADTHFRGAVDWLLRSQHPSGAWTNHPGLSESVTATSFALLALLETNIDEETADRVIKSGLSWLAHVSSDTRLPFVKGGQPKISATLLAAHVTQLAQRRRYDVSSLVDVLGFVKKAARGAVSSLFDNQVEDETFNTFRTQYEHFNIPVVVELLSDLGESDTVLWPFLRHFWKLQEPGRGAACTTEGRRTCWATAQWLLAMQRAVERAENGEVLKRLDQPERALVMKGGGVKGLALAGALTVFEEKGIRFDVFAGTSAGAIAAILLAAGYTGEELAAALRRLDFREFLDKKRRMLLNLYQYGALHRGASIQKWLRERIEERFAKRPVRLFHLGRRAIVFSANHTGTVTFDSHGSYRDLPADFSARCSMSIPYFFRAHEHEGEAIYDGGLLNNFPLGKVVPLLPGAEIVGLYLQEVDASWFQRLLMPKPLRIMLSQDEASVVDKNDDKMVIIDPAPIGTVQFDLLEEEKDLLILRGRAAALRFLHGRHDGLITASELQDSSAAANNALQKVVARRKKTKRRTWGVALLTTSAVALLWYLATIWLA